MPTKRRAYRIGGVVSAILVLIAARHAVPIGLTEMLGAITGAWGVWLTVEESLWTWPVGMVSSLLFAVLFFHDRFYGSAGMQLLYVAFSAVGWYWWLHGGERGGALAVSRAAPLVSLSLMMLVCASTPGLAELLRHGHDSAPFPDALALALCLGAQYLVTRKFVEHWGFSIAADIVYIALYWSHGLFLTGSLYLMHGGTCVVGLWQWRRCLLVTAEPAPPAEAALV